tara:strand:+ start:421 stop:627 length:207 start_codon:yes stop_codon:yes gene_type:complete
MKKNVNGVEIEMTAEEIAAKEKEDAENLAEIQKEKEAFEARENLKASAKSKLVAGEPLTQEEADTIVL